MQGAGIYSVDFYVVWSLVTFSSARCKLEKCCVGNVETIDRESTLAICCCKKSQAVFIKSNSFYLYVFCLFVPQQGGHLSGEELVLFNSILRHEWGGKEIAERRAGILGRDVGCIGKMWVK